MKNPFALLRKEWDQLPAHEVSHLACGMRAVFGVLAVLGLIIWGELTLRTYVEAEQNYQTKVVPYVQTQAAKE